jgi:hypothetical protein
MKKFMILLIFLKFLIVKSGDDFIFKLKCEDDKAKTGACMYHLSDYDSKGHDKYALFDKCGKGEQCSISYGVCMENLEKRKIGKSCNYDEDCITGLCSSNKCTAAKEGEKCKKDSSCERGLECTQDSNNNYKCVKLVKQGEKIETSKPDCMEGLEIDKDNKCVKYGTVDDKTEIGFYTSSLICKSGFAHFKYDDKNIPSRICDSVKTEPVCDENGLKTKGKWSDDTEIADGCMISEDYTGANKCYSKYSNLKSKLFADFLEDYKDLDIDNLNTNEKYTSWFDGMKAKTREKWLLYEYANELRAAGIIDSDGKVIKDKKCEYEFLKKYLDSNYIKLNTIILALIALLF